MIDMSRFFAAALLFFALSFSSRAMAQGVSDLDLTTPRRAATVFVDAASHGDFETASLVLESRAAVPKSALSIDLARKLYLVISHTVFIELDEISDDPKGNPNDGELTERIAVVRLEGRDVPILLARTRAEPARWFVSTSTLTRVPELFEEHGPSMLEKWMPPGLRKGTLGLARWQWIGLALAIFTALLIARIVIFVVGKPLGRIAKRTAAKWDDELLVALRSPALLLVSAVAYFMLMQPMTLPVGAALAVRRLVSSLAIVSVTWMLFGVVGVIANVVEERASDEAALSMRSGQQARGVRTQVRVLRRVVNLALAACAAALMLTQFEAAREVGVSLLASAGLAGIVLGLAAQRTIGSLFAGIQLSITQPIRLGDSVLVENEFGTIEEVTLTYVVVKLWDERRLIVPMTRFLEQPFQNWTKVGTQLHGTVMLYADWTLPMAALRKELDVLLEGNPKWDGRTKKVHVTDAKERTSEIRVLVSAHDATLLFELRTELREKLVAWMASYEGGRHLPTSRALDQGK